MGSEASKRGDSCPKSISRRRDAEIAELAGANDGVLPHCTLLEIGLSPEQIKYRLKLGRLIPIHAGVYAVGHASLTRSGRLRAASLIASDVALSHSSAGEWHEILSPRTGLIHITCPRLIRRPKLIAHRRTLPADELETVDGALTTSLARTLLDIAATEGEDTLTKALRVAERRRLSDPVGLPALIARYPGARGTAIAQRTLDAGLYRAMTESWLEDVFLPFLIDRVIPQPLVNPTLHIAGRTFRPDCLWPDQRLIVELDGRADHELELGFESDRERDAELVAAGYRVIRITRRQLELDPDGVERRLRAALAVPHGVDARAA